MSQPTPEEKAAQRLTDRMLAVIRAEFYPDCPDKQFFQEQAMLIRGISHPAAWMKLRGAKLPGAEYQRILMLVINTIKLKGRQARRARFSAYFVVCVQEHMNHHGDEYYQAAKCRRVGDLLPSTLRRIRVGDQDDPTDVLAQAHSLVRSKGGRRRAIQKRSEPEPDLFSSGTPAAAPVHGAGSDSGKFPEPLPRRRDFVKTPHMPSQAAGSS